MSSAVGMGDAKDIARALTASIRAYGAENLSAAAAAEAGVSFVPTRAAFLNAPGEWTPGHYKAPECAFVAGLLYEALKARPAWAAFIAREPAPPAR